MTIQPKILCLFSAPLVTPDGEPVDTLDLDTERDTIIQELAAINREIVLRIGVATTDELATGISDNFNILHLSCHGNQDFLLFEDGKGGSHMVPGDYLKRLIGAAGPFELAIVSACHSEKIGKMLNEAGIKHVIAVRYDVPVLDKAATAFTEHFYRHLMRGDPLQKAFEMAKLMVEGNPELDRIKSQLELIACTNDEPFVAEEEKFVLLPPDEPSFHFNSLISKDLPKGELSIEQIKKSNSNLFNRPKSFTGRSIEMHDIITELLTNQLVTITGAGGIGKTTCALEVMRWFHSRGYFKDGIFHVDLRQTETTDGIISILGATLEVPFSETSDVIEYLRNNQCLLLLDNMEEVLWNDEKAAQRLVNEILKFCPATKLLVTSQREVGGHLHEREILHRIYPLEQNYAA
ncbi:MAG: CHAT domain-containing protein, partial [Thermodesulfovibrionia bacterium]|nr:CHAT domain-containing protein [Thermodesulfovibrionia bacterium]